jgi:hypothetical protein
VEGTVVSGGGTVVAGVPEGKASIVRERRKRRERQRKEKKEKKREKSRSRKPTGWSKIPVRFSKRPFG